MHNTIIIRTIHNTQSRHRCIILGRLAQHAAAGGRARFLNSTVSTSARSSAGCALRPCRHHPRVAALDDQLQVSHSLLRSSEHAGRGVKTNKERWSGKALVGAYVLTCTYIVLQLYCTSVRYVIPVGLGIIFKIINTINNNNSPPALPPGPFHTRGGGLSYQKNERTREK